MNIQLAARTLRVRSDPRFRPLALLVGLNLADLVTTWWALHLGAYEVNPVTAPFIHSYVVTAAVKVAVIGGVCWMVSRPKLRIAPIGRAVCQAWFACGVYAVVILNNVEVLRLALTHH